MSSTNSSSSIFASSACSMFSAAAPQPKSYRDYNNAGQDLCLKCKRQMPIKEQAKYLKQAQECFNKALELKPDYGEAWFNLGTVIEFMAEQQIKAEGVSFSAALGCIKKCKALDYSNDVFESFSQRIEQKCAEEKKMLACVNKCQAPKYNNDDFESLRKRVEQKCAEEKKTLQKSRSEMSQDAQARNTKYDKLVRDYEQLGYEKITRDVNILEAFMRGQKIMSVGGVEREVILMDLQKDSKLHAEVERQFTAKCGSGESKRDLKNLESSLKNIAAGVLKILPDNCKQEPIGAVTLEEFGKAPYNGGVCRHGSLYTAYFVSKLLAGQQEDEKAEAELLLSQNKVNIYRESTVLHTKEQKEKIVTHTACTLKTFAGNSITHCYLIEWQYGSNGVFDLLSEADRKRAQDSYNRRGIPGFLTRLFSDIGVNNPRDDTTNTSLTPPTQEYKVEEEDAAEHKEADPVIFDQEAETQPYEEAEDVRLLM